MFTPCEWKVISKLSLSMGMIIKLSSMLTRFGITVLLR